VTPPKAKPALLGEAAEGTTVRLAGGSMVVVTGRYSAICWVREVVDGREGAAPIPMGPETPLAGGS
jgi:hypothetical protein